MTLANLIVNVEANTVKLTKDVEQINGQLDKVSGLASKVGTAMVAAFTVTALVGFGKQLLDFSGHVSDLSAKLGISTDWVQKFELAFSPAGVSIDQVAAASLKLSKNLVGDDKATVSALQKMGLSLKDLKGMAPEQQFLTVADAVGKIESPTEKAYAAMTVFGKGGAELLPALTGHLKETTAEFEAMGLIIDKETIAAADNLGDQLGLMGKQLLGIVATVIGPLLPAVSALGTALMWIGNNVIGPVLSYAIKGLISWFLLLWEQMTLMLARLADLAQKVPIVGKYLTGLGDASDWLKKSSAAATEKLGDMWNTTDKTGESAKAATPHLLGLGGASEDAEKAAKKAADAHEKFTKELEKNLEAARKLDATLPGLTTNFGHLDSTDIELAKHFVETNAQLVILKKRAEDVEGVAHEAAFGFKGMADDLVNLGEKSTEIDQVKQHLDDVAESTDRFYAALNTLATGAGGIRGTISALQDLSAAWDQLSGDQKGGAIAATAVGAGFDALAAATENPDTKKGQVMNYAAKGAKWGTIVPGLGTLAGFGIGAAVGALKVSPVEIAARKDYADWQEKIIGQFDQMATKQQVMEAHGRDWAKVNITVRDAYEAVGMTGDEAMHDLSVALDATHHSAADVEQALIKINQALDDQQEDAANLNTAIEKYGFTIDELGPTMRRQQMSEQAVTLMNDFRLLVGSGIEVDTVLGKMGGSINEFVNTAIRTGTEVPSQMQPMLQKMIENQELLDENGVAFENLGATGLTFSETMTQGFDRVVQKFDELLTKIGLIPAAVSKIPNHLDIDVEGHYRGPDLGGGSLEETAGGSELGFASGTRGRYLDFGRGTRVTLHGRERVSTEAEGRAAAASNADVVAAINGLRRDLPRAVSVASRAADLRKRRAA